MCWYRFWSFFLLVYKISREMWLCKWQYIEYCLTGKSFISHYILLYFQFISVFSMVLGFFLIFLTLLVAIFHSHIQRLCYTGHSKLVIGFHFLISLKKISFEMSVTEAQVFINCTNPWIIFPNIFHLEYFLNLKVVTFICPALCHFLIFGMFFSLQ